MTSTITPPANDVSQQKPYPPRFQKRQFYFLPPVWKMPDRESKPLADGVRVLQVVSQGSKVSEVLADGSKIEGEHGDIKNGTGFGTRIFPTGRMWKGQLMNGVLNGHGWDFNPDGSVTEGTFKNGVVDGKATVTGPNGEIKHDGIFEGGVFTYKRV